MGFSEYFCIMEDNREERRRQWWLRNKGKYEKRESMLRRMAGHDYYGRCIYMITLNVAGRRDLLGELRGADACHSEAWVAASSLGEKVIGYWQEIPSHHPEVRVLKHQLMPDHFHGIIFVTEKIPVHLGTIINSFKSACTFAAKELGISTPLWEKGYNDSILKSRGQYDHMKSYLADNPRRLMVKRSSRDFFFFMHSLHVGGREVDAVGNVFLLDYPVKVAVRCSRSLSEEEIDEKVSQFLEMARHGTVLVSPAISPGEKKVMKMAQEAQCRVIKIVDNGFSDMYKPAGKDFDACARGDLLLVSPWAHRNEKIDLTKQLCEELNSLAAAIAQGE